MRNITSKGLEKMLKLRIGLILLAVVALFCSFTVPLVNTHEASSDSGNGLVAYYPFNGNANDESGNGNDGAIYGATLTEDRLGNPNSAYSFDGIDDYIEMNYTPGFNFGTGDFAVAGWFYVRNMGSGDISLLSRWQSSNWAWDLRIGYPSGGGEADKIYFGFGDSHSNLIMISDTVSINAWHHIAVTRRGGILYGYLDSVEFDAGVQNGSASGTSSLRLSNFQDYYQYPGYLDGFIDEVRIYNRALSTSEILALFNNSSVSPTPTPTPTLTPTTTTPTLTLTPTPTQTATPAPTPTTPPVTTSTSTPTLAPMLTPTMTPSSTTPTPALAGAPSAGLPADGATITDNTPLFTWSKIPNATNFELQVATDPSFGAANLVIDESLGDVSAYEAYNELANGTYYWRVRGTNPSTSTASPWSFGSFTLDITNDMKSSFPIWIIGAAGGGLALLAVIFLTLRWNNRRMTAVGANKMRMKQLKAQMHKWENEGYDVSRLRALFK